MRPRPSRLPLEPNVSREFWDALDDMDRRIPVATVDPTAAPDNTDDSNAGYQVGSRWYYADNEYVCVSNAPNLAIWKQTTT